MSTMKAVVIHYAGGPEVLNLEDRPMPAPKPGWVLIRVRAFGGIVTLTKNGPILLLDHEAKPLKMSISTIGESPRFRCESG